MAERGVVQRSPTFPSIKHQAKPPTAKKRRAYPFAIIATAIGAAIILLAVLRPDGSPSRSSQAAETSDKRQVVGEAPVSPPNPRADWSQRAQLADPRPTEFNSLPTGTRIEEDVGIDGNGELTVENGTDEDAVTKLSDATTDETVREFFVTAHSSANTAEIPQGTYRLKFTTGINWIKSEDTFRWHPSYYEFERTFEYKEERGDEGVRFKTISVTLHSVPFGNLRTKTITREEFLKGHRHVALQQ